MEKITIDNIITFTKEAVKSNLHVDSYFNNTLSDDNTSYFRHYISIRNNKEKISFDIDLEAINLFTEHGTTRIEYILTEREKVNLESLHLDIKEYNKERALHKFKTFFNEMTKLADIDDLDNEDD